MEQQTPSVNAASHPNPLAGSWRGFWLSLIAGLASATFLVWARPHMPPHTEVLRMGLALGTAYCFLRTIAEFAVIRDARRARAMNTAAK